MKHAENPPAPASYVGHVKNGVVVLDAQVPLAEGQVVRVEPVGQGMAAHVELECADRVRELQRLFAEWTEEDGKLSDEDADRLRKTLERSRGLRFHSPIVE